MLEEICGHFPTMREAENYLIDYALKVAQGNQGTAATMLGLKRQTLNVRLKNRKNYPACSNSKGAHRMM
jgi:two-component system, NtrC family, response regulator HydG